MTTSESPQVPEAVLTLGSQMLKVLSSVIMTECFPGGWGANSLAQHLLLLGDWHFLMKLIHHKIFIQLCDTSDGISLNICSNLHK